MSEGDYVPLETTEETLRCSACGQLNRAMWDVFEELHSTRQVLKKLFEEGVDNHWRTLPENQAFLDLIVKMVKAKDCQGYLDPDQYPDK